MISLESLEKFRGRQGSVVLCIMDGIACGPDYSGNAVSRAFTPNLDWLRDHCLNTKLKAHGAAVGMPTDKE